MIVKICAIGFNADLKYAVFEEGGKTLAFCRHGSDAELIRAAADPAPGQEEEPTDTCTSPPAPLPGNIRVTVGGTINLQNYENIKVEVEGNSAEECTRILVDTLNGFATNPAYSTTRDLIQSYM